MKTMVYVQYLTRDPRCRRPLIGGRVKVHAHVGACVGKLNLRDSGNSCKPIYKHIKKYSHSVHAIWHVLFDLGTCRKRHKNTAAVKNDVQERTNLKQTTMSRG